MTDVEHDTSRIGCAICAAPIGLDEVAIELLSTTSFEQETAPGEPDLFVARPNYVHQACGIPDRDVEVRHGLMRELRPPA